MTKKLLVIFISLIVFCTFAFVWNCGGSSKDENTEKPRIFKNGLGNINFYHDKHTVRQNNVPKEQTCSQCHFPGGYEKAKYTEANREKRKILGHKVCVSCHKKNNKSKCDVCHEK